MGKDDDKIKTTIFTSKGTRRTSGLTRYKRRSMLSMSNLDFRDFICERIETKSLSVTHLKAYSLNQYKHLKLVKLDKTLKKIDEYIFYKDTEIVIEFSGTISKWEKIKKHPDWASGCKSVIIVCLDGKLDIKF